MLVALVATTTVFAQGLEETSASFPDPERTITIIVPQGAGGGTDTFARTLAAKMTEISGQNFIVENITGNSTGTGTNEVIKSEPDGYKMLMYGTYTIVGTSVGATDGASGLDFISGLTLSRLSLVSRLTPSGPHFRSSSTMQRPILVRSRLETLAQQERRLS